MHFGTQEGLATAKAGADGTSGHPSLWRRTHSFLAPHIQVQAMTGKPSREAKFTGIEFPDPLTKDRSAHRIHQVSRQQTVVLMAAVEWRYKIEALPIGRLEQALDPRRSEVGGFRRDDCAGPGSQQIRGG